MISPLTSLLRREHREPRSHDDAVRMIGAHRGPAIVTCLDTVLYERTKDARAKRGEVLVFDPFGLSAAVASGWSPLHGCATWAGALRTAARLAKAGEIDQRGVDGRDFWTIAADQLLAPLLFAGASDDRTIETVVGWAYGLNRTEFEQTLSAHAHLADDPAHRRDAQAALQAVADFNAQPDRTRSSVEASVQALLRAWRFTRVARSSHSHEITPERLLSGANTVYLIGDAKAAKLLRPIMSLLLADLAGSQLDASASLLLAEGDLRVASWVTDTIGRRIENGSIRYLPLPDDHAPTASPRGPRRLKLRSPVTFA